jgi:hypothetical protein
MSKQEYDAAMAAFLAKKQITRCPTAFAVPTHTATTTEADREALRRHAAEREAARSAALGRPA